MAPTVQKPEAEDCLFGRGKAFQNHPGNKKMHQLVDAMLVRYVLAEEVSAKNEMIETIVKQVRATGRFLKRAPLRDDDGASSESFSPLEWIEADDREAFKKIGHTVRSRMRSNPAVRKIIDQREQQKQQMSQQRIRASLGTLSHQDEGAISSAGRRLSLSNVLSMRNNMGEPARGPPLASRHVDMGDPRMASSFNANNIERMVPSGVAMAPSMNSRLVGQNMNDQVAPPRTDFVARNQGSMQGHHLLQNQNDPKFIDLYLLDLQQRQQAQAREELRQRAQAREEQMMIERQLLAQQQQLLLQEQRQQQQQPPIPDLRSLSDEQVFELLRRSRMNEQLRLQELHFAGRPGAAVSNGAYNNQPDHQMMMQMSDSHKLSSLMAQQRPQVLAHQQLQQQQHASLSNLRAMNAVNSTSRDVSMAQIDRVLQYGIDIASLPGTERGNVPERGQSNDA